MNGKIGLRIVSALVLIAALAGIAFFAFRAGVAQGSPITIEAPSGETVPAPYPYYGFGYGPRFHHPFGFGLGCFGILIPLFLFFLALKAFRFAVWGPRWGWGGHRHGPWGRHWVNGVPPMFEEWHKRAHGEEPEEKKE
ncbi:MAG: hypothetical protein L6Q26_05020 [Anaerolineales bacterium]|nr:hypothetical protein [Anaerolineales bacterium]NUQ83362.1 hypothetical protein [Anaerolineales bacterium]